MRKPIMRRGSNAVFDFIASRLEMDRLLEDILAIFLVVVSILSMISGIAVWPVVWDLKSSETSLGDVCRHISTSGWVIALVCLVITILLMLWQRHDLKPLRTFLLNLGIYWVIACVILISQQNILTDLTQSSFMGTLLWIILSFILSYILSVLPSLLITLISTLAHKILDLILPV